MMKANFSFQVQNLKQSLELQRKDLNDCRAEITALKMQIEGFRSGRLLAATEADHPQSDSIERYREEIKSLQMEIETLKSRNTNSPDSLVSISSDNEFAHASEKIVEIHEDKSAIAPPVDASPRVVDGENSQSLITQIPDDSKDKSEERSQGLPVNPSNDNSFLQNSESVSKLNGELPSEDSKLLPKSDNLSVEADSEKTASSLLSVRHQSLDMGFIRNSIYFKNFESFKTSCHGFLFLSMHKLLEKLLNCLKYFCTVAGSGDHSDSS